MYALVIAVFGAGCSGEEPEVYSPPMVLVEDDEMMGALVDSLWQELGPSVVGGPSLNIEGSWIVEARWLRFAERPDSIYTFGEMAHLDAEGVIGEETMVALVRYRFLIEADGLPEAQRKVEARMQAGNWPPSKVYEAMDEADRKAAEGGKVLYGG